MTSTDQKISPGSRFEAVFDTAYLLFDLIAGIILLQNGMTPVLKLYGFLALELGAGDAFHLVPRIRRALHGEEAHTERNLGLGLQVSSITMTIFYLILYAIWRLQYPDLHPSGILVFLLFASAAIRILLCLFPQNHWYSYAGNRKWSLYRNLPFLVTGICVIILFLISGNVYDDSLHGMPIAILISFACYFPVTLEAKKHPMIGMLMMPKTLAYVAMIVMGLNMLA